MTLAGVLAILLGALLGLAMKPVSDGLSKLLLKHRKLEFQQSKLEKIVYPLAAAVFGGLIAWRTQALPEVIYLFLLLPVCLTIAQIDIRHRIIPNELILAIIALKLIFGLTGLVEFSILYSALGLVCCFVIFMLPAALSKKVGAGDVKLAAAMGFCAGLMDSLYAVALMGVLVLVYIFAEQQMPFVSRLKQMAPMGPFMAGALMVVLILI